MEITGASHKCENCNHKPICKYVENMSETHIKVSKIHAGFNNPIKININCANFEKKIQKQDAIFRK